MKNRKMLERGLYVAAGLFLGNAFLVPLISDQTIVEGIVKGVLAGFLAMGFFAILGVFVPVRDDAGESGDR